MVVTTDYEKPLYFRQKKNKDEGRTLLFISSIGRWTLPWGTTLGGWAKMTPRRGWKLNDGL